MIEVTAYDSERGGMIVLRPNQSMSWQAMKIFLGALLLLSLTIAISFLAQGYWLILPFTILEVSVVSFSFFYLLKRSQQQQVIELTQEDITISEGIRRPDRVWRWQRFFAKVIVNEPRYAWHPKRIEIRHQGDSIEIGSFLNVTEKEELINALGKLIQKANQATSH